MSLFEKIKQIKISDFSSYVIMAFIFSIPISTSASSILASLLVSLWIIEGNFKNKFEEIKKNKVTLAVLAYVLLHVVGLLWTSDYSWGYYTIQKQWKLLLLPIFLTMVKKEYTWRYINAFVAAMIVSTIFSYTIWLEIFSYKDSSPANPSPFIKHVMYNPLLALAIYLLSYQLKFCNISFPKKIIIAAVILAMIINMFLVPGRTGQAAFFFLGVFFLFQIFKRKNTIAAACIIIIPLIFTTAYFSVPQFKNRIVNSVDHIKNFDFDARNSLAERATFIVVSSLIYRNNPIIGVGTGDFPQAYSQITSTKFSSFGYSYSENPHNQYLLVLSQFGIIGLLIFSFIFYFQIKFATISNFPFNLILITFPLFYLLIFLGDSFLQVSGTTLLFSIFSAFLYKEA